MTGVELAAARNFVARWFLRGIADGVRLAREHPTVVLKVGVTDDAICKGAIESFNDLWDKEVPR